MAASPKRQLSLDTNVLLDLAQPQDFAHEFREEFQRRGYALLLAPTVLFELEYLLTFGNPAEKILAQKAYDQVEAWQLTAFDLPDVRLTIAEEFSRRLQHQGLLPAAEFNDGLILAETSLGNIPLLVTSDKHLLDIDEDALLLAFNEADLPPVRPAHPKRLLKALR
ncbi:MAG: PIN domain-containing protein [Pedosphaera sp.]|nr:PIN domain-containing protein [Pedosphaera sp.]